eukprot:1772162-Alexandrium_andersonii.AAC.1
MCIRDRPTPPRVVLRFAPPNRPNVSHSSHDLAGYGHTILWRFSPEDFTPGSDVGSVSSLSSDPE